MNEKPYSRRNEVRLPIHSFFIKNIIHFVRMSRLKFCQILKNGINPRLRFLK